MIKKWIDVYKNKSYEEKVLWISRYSIIQNDLFFIFKVFIGLFFKNYLFCFAGLYNFCIARCKQIGYRGIKENEVFPYRRLHKIAYLLIFASLCYIIYMSRLLFISVTLNYTLFEAIFIACVSFCELGMAIYGMIKVKEKGFLFKAIKWMNLIAAMIAILSTQIALLAYQQSSKYHNLMNGICGIVLGVFVILISIYIYHLPTISYQYREQQSYIILNQDTFNCFNAHPYRIKKEASKMTIYFTNNRWIGKYYYQGILTDLKIEGKIGCDKIKWREISFFLKVIIILLSEILIFVYLFMKLLYFFKTINLVKKLNYLMTKNGCIQNNV